MPSRWRRLDGALGDLPLEEPMLLTELDGFLTGIVVCGQAIPVPEWMQSVWGPDGDGVPPFEDPLDVQWFADAVQARHGEIARDLARGRPRPILDVDERDGDVLWEAWIEGFAEAMALRPDAWTGEAAVRMGALVAVARDESGLDSIEINAFQDRAVGEIVDVVQRLHDESPRRQQAPEVTSQGKAGRNDPCPCGSGKKFKRCCVGVS